MERAGDGVVTHLAQAFGPFKGKHIVILCGKGNNGGDGLVAARLLKKFGAKLTVVLMSPYQKLSKDAKTMYRRLLKKSGPSVFVVQPPPPILRTITENADVLVDALLGTGLSSPVREPYLQAIQAINASPAFTLSIDIPSGLNGATGTPMGATVSCDLTVTLGCYKIGLFMGPAIDLVGKVELVDIGIPQEYVEALNPQQALLTPSLIQSLIPPRPLSAHKGTFGHAGIIAGSPGKAGAPALAGLGALRTGTGLVTVATPKSISSVVEAKLLEIMAVGLQETSENHLGRESLTELVNFCSGKSALAFGPGLGTSPSLEELLCTILPKLTVPCVLDADALNNLASHVGVFSGMAHTPVLTPHPGEMARLLGLSSGKEVNQDRIRYSLEFATQHQVILVLKGAKTVIANPQGEVAICPTGNPGMASAGMGDVLTGIITGLLAQGLSPWDGARAGVYLHGLAGDLAARQMGQPGLIASDVLASLPHALLPVMGGPKPS